MFSYGSTVPSVPSMDSTQYEGRTTDRVIKCLYCSQAFPSFLVLQSHLSQHLHPSLKTMQSTHYQIEPYYQCRRCNTQISYRQCMFRHPCFTEHIQTIQENKRRLIRKGSPTFCLGCGTQALPSSAHLLFHMIVHHAKNFDPKLCPICGAIFKTACKSAIEAHVFQVHLPYQVLQMRQREKQKVCFSRKHLLYHCLCSDRTPSLYKQLMHNRNCNRSFSTIDKLCGHIVAVHSVGPHPVHGREHRHDEHHNFCYSCDIEFLNSKELRYHINSRHEPQYLRVRTAIRKQPGYRAMTDLAFLCIYCYFLFSTHADLQAHISAAHSILSWSHCGLCGYEYCKADEKVNANLWWMYVQAHEKHHSKTLVEHVEEVKKFDIVCEELHSDKIETFPEEFSYFSKIKLIDSLQIKYLMKLKKDLPGDVVEKMKDISEKLDEQISV